jgi:hypothetical protein
MQIAKAFSRTVANEYMKCISDKLEDKMGDLGKIKQSKDETELKTPTYSNYSEVLKINYPLNEIKNFALQYKLKVSGSKREILCRIYAHLHLSVACLKIQRVARGSIGRKYMKSHGPAHKKRSLCTNDTDFMTMDSLSELDFHYFISYKDEDGFIYGFDMVSLYNLIEKNPATATNPYNRKQFPKTLINDFSSVLRISICLNKVLNLNIEADIISPAQSVELKALDLFQKIDALGNYSDPQWFLSLSRNKLAKFARELHDIFSYRAQLVPEIKRNICPPHGEPFYNVNLHYIQHTLIHYDAQMFVLSIIDKFVNQGINVDSKSLGAYYVLAALTLVNETAAASLPWLYQSVVYL